MTDPVSVVLADDSTTIRALLSALLGEVPEIDLVAVAADGETAVVEVLAHRPDVVIMDMQMPGLGGLDATKQILAQWPEARIIMNTAYSDDDLRLEAQAIGAAGYVTKDQRPANLVATVLEIASS